MGTTQSILTPEVTITALVIAGSLGLGYTQLKPAPSAPKNAVVTPADTTKKSKKKKGKASSATKEGVAQTESEKDATSVIPTPPSIPNVIRSTSSLPGEFEPSTFKSDDAAEPTKAKKSKKKKGKSAATSSATIGGLDASLTVPEYPSDSSAGPIKQPQPKSKRQSPSSSSQLKKPVEVSTASIDTDQSWTRVETRRPGNAGSGTGGKGGSHSRDVTTTSDAGITTSITENSSTGAEITEEEEEEAVTEEFAPKSQPRRPWAERALPKPRKTGVEDMLETPDYPSVSRVIRVRPLPDEKPASGFSWGDYEDVRVADSSTGAGNDADGEDDGWGVVKSKSRSRAERGPNAQSHVSKKPSSTTPEAMTKKQRQNAQKREAAKVAKAEGEAQRLAALAQHRRESEKAKLLDSFSSKGAGKSVSGGMKASVDEHGQLVWE